MNSISSIRPAFGRSSDTKWKAGDAAHADAWVIPVWQRPEAPANATEEGQATPSLLDRGPLAALNAQLGGMLRKVFDREEFTGGKGQQHVFEVPPDAPLSADRIVVVGLGEQGKIKPGEIETTLAQAFKPLGTTAKSLAIDVPPLGRLTNTLQAMVDAIAGAVARHTYRTEEATEKKAAKTPNVERVTVMAPDDDTREALRGTLKQAKTIAQAVSYARDLANAPHLANVRSSLFGPDTEGLTAEALARQAEQLAEQHPQALRISVTRNPKTIKEQYPGVYFVNRGARKKDPARVIQLKYRNPGQDPNQPVKKIALVGKAIMFDTGGVQDKGTAMNGMHMDMHGAANVLATMKALAELQPKGVEVTAYIGAATNKDGPEAYTTDTRVKTRSGKVIRIDHTDAEGRVTLLDMITRASEDNPDVIIEQSTLTGAAVMAIGKQMGLIALDDRDAEKPVHAPLVDAVFQAARAYGEPVETLWIQPAHVEQITAKDDDAADIVNVAGTAPGTPCGAQAAGATLTQGLKPRPDGSAIPFLHMDIAGTMGKAKSEGIGVRTPLYYILAQAQA